MLEMVYQGGRPGPTKQASSATTRALFATLCTPGCWLPLPGTLSRGTVMPHRSRHPAVLRSDPSVLERRAPRNRDSGGEMCQAGLQGASTIEFTSEPRVHRRNILHKLRSLGPRWRGSSVRCIPDFGQVPPLSSARYPTSDCRIEVRPHAG